MENYLLFTAAFILSAATPGPDIVAVVGKALSQRRASLCLCLIGGIIAGKLVLLAAALLGLSALAVALGPVFVTVKYAGAAYLAWIGVKLFRRQQHLREPEIQAPAGALKEASLGLALSLGNPVAILFYVALLPNVVEVEAASWGVATSLAMIVAVCTLLIYGTYALLAACAGSLFRSPVGQRRVNRTSGAAMLGAAVLVATR